ncbi:MAG TPA: histidinol dehydrogenase [Planctomycetaceae bacterium]|nr:histidinol dehydrogenase [Planctomycetaceae bacterium]|tara:strand:- start:543 stop:1940 length:1398 start_codon:yes stop_codon:yes gene_type:complete
MPLDIITIDTRNGEATALIDNLRERLSPRGDIVSDAGRERTVEIFGEPLSPAQVVDRICSDVASGGLGSVLDYTRRLDGVDLTNDTLRVSREEFQTAHQAADPDYLATIRRIRDNIVEFQSQVLPQDVTVLRQRDSGAGEGTVELTQRYRPLRRVGVCVPGGAAAYPSTLLMTAVPARTAGVEQIAVVVPPTEFGGFNTDLLAACHELGITEVYRVGGAQAVAALAYGVTGIEAVDKIVGPGNLFVALAKQRVFGEVDIDSIAGPSEVVVLADETADPNFLASDLISQAEHSPGASVLLTWHEPLIAAVTSALAEQLAQLPRGDLATESLNQFGALVRVADRDEAIALSERMAPEHLHISTADPSAILDHVQNAGAIFLGHHTPVALGDYVAGPSHVLPTGGTARFANGLSANDFLKRSSVIRYDRDSLAADAADVCRMAETEGLTAHAASITIRLDDSPPGESS